MDHFYYISIAVGVGVPSGTAAIYVIKSFMAKAKYHATMEGKLKSLEEKDKGSDRVHDGQNDRLKELEDKVQKLCDNVEDTKGWIRLILNHLKIPFPDKRKSS